MRLSKSAIPAPKIYLSLMACGAAAAIWLFITCPFLNYDDIVYNTVYFEGQSAMPALDRFWRLLMNTDVGAGQFRTYGLARLFQYYEMAALGRSALATYTAIILFQAAIALVLAWALKNVVRDALTRTLIAFIWLLCPFILITSHTLHHYLYTVGPYVFVFLWIGITLNHPRAHWALGAASLTAAWLMGEAVIPVVFLLLAMGATDPQRRASIAKQAVGVVLVLAAYVAYQHFAIYNPDLERWAYVAPQNIHEVRIRADQFFTSLFKFAGAGLGFEYLDPHVGGAPTAGLTVFEGWIFWVPLAALLALIPSLNEARGAILAKYLPYAVLLAASSAALYFVSFVATGMPPLVARYVPPIGALFLICLTLVGGSWLNRPRMVAAIVCAVCLCGSMSALSTLHKTVYPDFVVKIERLKAAREEGKTAVLIYNRLPDISIPRLDQSYPALTSPYDSAVRTPFAAMWVTDYYLRFITGFQHVGSDFREIDETSVEIVGHGGKTVVEKSDLVIVGMVSDHFPTQHAQVVWYKSWHDFELHLSGDFED